MKIPETTYNTLLGAIGAIVDHKGGAIVIRRSFTIRGLSVSHSQAVPSSELRMLWDLYHIATRNIMYDDTHPLYQNGTWVRIYPYQPNWNIYSLGINDTHIETALRRIGKKLELL